MALTNCRECKGTISSTARACPHCGRKINKTSPTTWAVSLVLLAGTCYGVCHQKDPNEDKNPSVLYSMTNGTSVSSETLESLPWLGQIQENCRSYNAAPNDIKRSEIFRANESALGRVRIKEVKGKLRDLFTTQGGGRLRLRISVGSVAFSTEIIFDPIARGSKVYAQASTLQEGDCVVFSARSIESNSMLEKSKVCSFGHFATFTAVRRCGT